MEVLKIICLKENQYKTEINILNQNDLHIVVMTLINYLSGCGNDKDTILEFFATALANLPHFQKQLKEQIYENSECSPQG